MASNFHLLTLGENIMVLNPSGIENIIASNIYFFLWGENIIVSNTYFSNGEKIL